MILRTYFIIFSSFFSFIKASHFLGGSFTYRQNPQINNKDASMSIFVEIRFHITHHYFRCTDERVNQHMIGYLVGEDIPYNAATQQYDWFNVHAFKRDSSYYNIHCVSTQGQTCTTYFQERMWGYCESTNENVQYSILRRQFKLNVSKYQWTRIYYTSCCWATSTGKLFHFYLNIYPIYTLNNSSPYPYIPASYYVSLKHPRDIKILIYDADNDEVLCETSNDTLNGFLTVKVSSDCKLSYQYTRLNKQFGQFWLMDRRNNQILSSSLINVQVHVLDDIVCDQLPELIVKNKADSLNSATIRINQTVHISVSLRPNCLKIPLEVQTITELTTFCANERPVVTANNGIEVVYQCTPVLCEKHHICFVGEFNLTLPSTNVVCFHIDAVGDSEECARAIKNYNYSRPHDRYFKIWNSIKSKSSDDKTPSIVQLEPVKPNIRNTTVIASQSTSRTWLWILVASVFLSLIGFVGYFGYKHLLAAFYQYSMNSSQQRFSNRDGSFDTIGTRMAMPKADQKLKENLLPLDVQPDNISISSSKSKAHSQHLKIGPLDEYD